MEKTHLVVVNVQPTLTQYDYKSPERLKSKLIDTINKHKQTIESTKKEGDEILIVFPETIGSWLVTSREPFFIYWFPTILLAMICFILLHPISFLQFFLHEIRNNPQQFAISELVKRSIFRSKAKQMYKDYVEVFSSIAKQYHAYVVAGSIFLPRVKEGQLTDEGLYNVSLTFDPSGKICYQTHKCNLIPDEIVFLNAGKEEDEVNVFSTKWGNLSVFICADSWVPSLYSRLEPRKVDLIAVPALISPAHEWQEPWKGYSVSINQGPFLYDKSDVNLKLESEMWLKYAVAGRMNDAGAFVGVTSFMGGKLWDMTMGGQSIVKVDNVLYQIASFAKEQHAIIVRVPSRRK